MIKFLCGKKKYFIYSLLVIIGLTAALLVNWVAVAEATLCRALVDCTGASNRVSGSDYNTLTSVVEIGSVQVPLGCTGCTISASDQISFEFPYAGTITAQYLVCDASGSLVLDIWIDSFANYPPTVADTITASAKPTLATAQTDSDTTLTGWTTGVSSGDWGIVNVDSVSTVTNCTLSLRITKTGT